MQENRKILTDWKNINPDLEKFSFMLENNSQCYKFYWLEALVNLLVGRDDNVITYDEAANEMIWNAWYTVAEYHLHMGSSYYGKDDHGGIERAVLHLKKLTGLPSTAKKKEVMRALHDYSDALKSEKIQMTKMVPARLLKPYVPELGGNNRVWNNFRRFSEYIRIVNTQEPLPYLLEDGKELNKKVVFNDAYAEMIRKYHLILLEWIRSKKIRYLQDRNPDVPGIVYKLEAPLPEGRHLTKVRALWKEIMKEEPVLDIYTNETLNGHRFDVDHFIPWSYIASDELWDLTPADASINRQKSNGLPKWDKYYPPFLHNQYQLYKEIQKNDVIHTLFGDCRRDNLNSLWASEELYLAGNSQEQFANILERNLKPVYDNARLQGYELWQIGETLSL